MVMVACVMAVVLLSAERNGVSIEIESPEARIDPGRSVMLTATLRRPAGVSVPMPDLGARARGFSLAEDFAEEPRDGGDGTVVETVQWRLVPEPCAARYAIAPFVVAAPGDGAFVAGPVRFEPPAPRPPAPGGMEADPEKELPPLSWRLAALAAGALAAAAALVFACVRVVGFFARRAREIRSSPVERAFAELERLLRKGLPGRGRYKDFYVELTMVVRRYVQRRYGVRAPHLTTEEFFGRAAAALPASGGRVEALRAFLESADMVKFAGVEATPEMADGATASARGYLEGERPAKNARTA
jgi:hypothetical protein